jgi:hypothetical protein
VLTAGVLLAVPITLFLGSIGLYSLLTAMAALVTGTLGVAGVLDRVETPVMVALRIAATRAALGLLALAMLGGYCWVIARVAGE